MTQQEINLIHWINTRNAARSWPLWQLAQERVDALFRAMGREQAAGAALADEMIFPAVRAAFSKADSGIGK